jgi:hypothetical protein
MVVWLTSIFLSAQNVLNQSNVLVIAGRMDLHAIQAFYALEYILHCLMIWRPMSAMSTSFILQPALLA